MKREEITLEIDAYTPATLPMARLAEYLTHFAALLGNDANVHFSRLAKGSARCMAYADEQAVPKVRERVEAVVSGTAPKQALKAHKEIDDLLAADNAIGGVFIGGHKLIEFPGRRRAQKEKIGPVRRETSLDGQIFMIGGKDETINVHLRNGEKVFRCEVSIDLAKRLAAYFLSGSIRLFGHGEWYRIDSRWEMANFVAIDFSELERQTLEESIEELRHIFSGVRPEGLLADLEELRRG